MILIVTVDLQVRYGLYDIIQIQPNLKQLHKSKTWSSPARHTFTFCLNKSLDQVNLTSIWMKKDILWKDSNLSIDSNSLICLKVSKGLLVD